MECPLKTLESDFIKSAEMLFTTDKERISSLCLQEKDSSDHFLNLFDVALKKVRVDQYRQSALARFCGANLLIQVVLHEELLSLL